MEAALQICAALYLDELHANRAFIRQGGAVNDDIRTCYKYLTKTRQKMQNKVNRPYSLGRGHYLREVDFTQRDGALGFGGARVSKEYQVAMHRRIRMEDHVARLDDQCFQTLVNLRRFMWT